jgi:beta-lactamase class A
MASTVKVPVVMTALHRVDLGKDRLDSAIRFSESDLARHYSVITEKYPHGGAVSLEQICRYTISQSDNTGVDLLFTHVGGPPAVQRYVNGMGFPEFHVDRRERELPDSAVLTDPRDTVTPRVMAMFLQRLWTNPPLQPATRRVLFDAMYATTTGDGRLRAGIPKSWRVADKTGTYDNAANDVGFLVPPHGQPIVLAVYAYGLAPEVAQRAIARVANVLTS